MGIFDNIGEQVTQHGETIDQAIEKGAQFIDEKTGGKHSEQINQAFAAVVPAVGLVMRWATPVIRDTQRRLDDASEKAAARAIEFAQAQPVLRATGRAGAGFAPMEHALDEQRRAFRRALARQSAPQYAYVGVVQAGLPSSSSPGPGWPPAASSPCPTPSRCSCSPRASSSRSSRSPACQARSRPPTWPWSG